MFNVQSKAAPYAHICYCNPTTTIATNTTVATNTHHCQPAPLTHHNQPPLMPPTTSTTHHGGWQWGATVVGGSDEWRQLMALVGGSGGLQGEKTSKFFFCSK